MSWVHSKQQGFLIIVMQFKFLNSSPDYDPVCFIVCSFGLRLFIQEMEGRYPAWIINPTHHGAPYNNEHYILGSKCGPPIHGNCHMHILFEVLLSALSYTLNPNFKTADLLDSRILFVEKACKGFWKEILWKLIWVAPQELKVG